MESSQAAASIAASMSRAANTGVAVITLDRGFVWVNPHFSEVLGYSADELVGRRIDELIHPAGPPLDEVAMIQFVTGVLPRYEFDKRCVDKSGKPVMLRLRLSPIHDQNGQTLYALVLMTKLASASPVKYSSDDGVASSDVDRIRRAILM